MKCWRCGKGNVEDKICPYCGVSQDRTTPITEYGKALRKIYDDFGYEKVFENSRYISSAIGDLLSDTESFTRCLDYIYSFEFGSLYKAQISNSGKPDKALYSRAKKIITEEAGFSEKRADQLIQYFDEMIGWKESEKPTVALSAEPHEDENIYQQSDLYPSLVESDPVTAVFNEEPISAKENEPKVDDRVISNNVQTKLTNGVSIERDSLILSGEAICPYCGEINSENALSCTFCGTAFSGSKQTFQNNKSSQIRKTNETVAPVRVFDNENNKNAFSSNSRYGQNNSSSVKNPNNTTNIQPVQYLSRNEEKESWKKAIIILSIIGVPMIIIVVSIVYYSNLNKYRESLYNATSENNDYSYYIGNDDSEEHATAADHYLEAETLIRNGKYESAINEFLLAGDYKDSKDRVFELYIYLGDQAISNSFYDIASNYYDQAAKYCGTSEKENELWYKRAELKMVSGDLGNAVQLFDQIKDYKDAAERIKVAYYSLGTEALDKKDYSNAIDYFIRAGDYKDSIELKTESQYQYALSKISEDSSLSINILSNLRGYKDSDKQILKAYYNCASQFYINKDYKAAVDNYAKAGNYSDSKKKRIQAMYLYVKEHLNRTDTTTYSYLTALKKAKYRDSAKLYKKLYAWHVTVLAVNNNANSMNKMSRISCKKTAVFHFRITGGPPNGWTHIKSKVKWPGKYGKWSNTTYAKDGNYKKIKYTNGDTDFLWFGWQKPSKYSAGKMILKFYDNSGNYIGSGSVKVVY